MAATSGPNEEVMASMVSDVSSTESWRRAEAIDTSSSPSSATIMATARGCST